MTAGFTDYNLCRWMQRMEDYYEFKGQKLLKAFGFYI